MKINSADLNEISTKKHSVFKLVLMKTCTEYFINAFVIGIFNPSKHFAVKHADCLVHKHLSANSKAVSNNLGK